MHRPISILLVAGWLLATPGGAAAQLSLTVSGVWNKTVDHRDLEAGPGSNLHADHDSPPDAAALTVSGAPGNGSRWRVDVRKVDNIKWHPRMALLIRRTSNGLGGSVSGGTNYQPLTATDQPFFTGAGNVTGINVQLKLSGVSLAVAPDYYATTVVYTVVSTP